MRKSYLALRVIGIKHMLLYPAKLKIIFQGKMLSFEHPEDVWNWLDMADALPVRTADKEDPFHTQARNARRNRKGGRNKDKTAKIDGTMRNSERGWDH